MTIPTNHKLPGVPNDIALLKIRNIIITNRNRITQLIAQNAKSRAAYNAQCHRRRFVYIGPGADKGSCIENALRAIFVKLFTSF